MNNIIWLNGVSSAGKTSISKILQNKLEDTYLHIQVDDFQNMFPTKHYMWTNEFWDIAIPMFSAFHHSIKAYYDNGVNLIVDHVLVNDEWKKECEKIFSNSRVIFIGVKCSLEVLQERVNKRDNRPDWIAEYQFNKVHNGLVYDFEIDTTTMTAEECSSIILEKIKTLKNPHGIKYIV